MAQVGFYDKDGKQLKMLYFRRMPEAGKGDLKAQLAAEVAHIRALRPDILIVVVADTARDNWTVSVRVPGDEEMVIRLLACLPAPGCDSTD